jgi:hypothetical protein
MFIDMLYSEVTFFNIFYILVYFASIGLTVSS